MGRHFQKTNELKSQPEKLAYFPGKWVTQRGKIEVLVFKGLNLPQPAHMPSCKVFHNLNTAVSTLSHIHVRMTGNTLIRMAVYMCQIIHSKQRHYPVSGNLLGFYGLQDLKKINYS